MTSNFRPNFCQPTNLCSLHSNRPGASLHRQTFNSAIRLVYRRASPAPHFANIHKHREREVYMYYLITSLPPRWKIDNFFIIRCTDKRTGARRSGKYKGWDLRASVKSVGLETRNVDIENIRTNLQTTNNREALWMRVLVVLTLDAAWIEWILKCGVYFGGRGGRKWGGEVNTINHTNNKNFSQLCRIFELIQRWLRANNGTAGIIHLSLVRNSWNKEVYFPPKICKS